MSDDVTLRLIGRVSEPSHTVAPKGSLLKASNCVVRKPGVVSPVPSTLRIAATDGPANQGVWQQSPQFDNGTYPEQLLHIGDGVSTNSGVRKSSDVSAEIQYTDPEGNASSITPYDHGDCYTFYPMHIARDNLYLCDQSGCYKWENTDATSLEPIWDISVGGSVTLNSGGGAGDWLAIGDFANYRFVVVFVDSNGLTRRSAASSPVYIENVAPGARFVDMQIRVHQGQADQFSTIKSVEMYRTRSSSVAPPNEYFLVSEYPWGNFSASNGVYVYSVSDQTLDTDLGTSLYTSSSQEGQDSSNFAPPEHLFHASWNGHEFWGNVSEVEVFPEIRYVVSPSTLTHSATTGTTAVGTNTITGVSVLGGAEVGMLISDSEFPAGTYITAISGAGPFVITVSNNSTGATTSTRTFVDTAYILWGDGNSDRVSLYQASDDMTPDVFDDPPTGYVRVLDRASRADADPYVQVLVLGSRHRCGRQGTAQIWVSNPSNFSGTDWADLNTGTGAPTTGGTEALKSLHRARIYWSKFQEPEHTTLLNFQDVGNASGIGGGDIVGLGALRDALIILKADGVFRLTGAAGNFRIDPVDTSVRVIGGRSTVVIDDAVYTLGDRGVLRITANSVENISDGVVGDWFREDSSGGDPRLESVRKHMENNDGYHPPCLFAAADLTTREYALMCDGTNSPAGDGTQDEILVYNAKTGAWTTWDIGEGFHISSLGYVRGAYISSSNLREPGISFGRQVSSGDTSACVFMLDNRADTEAAVHSTHTQDIRLRSLHVGDPTHIKLWQEVVWETSGEALSSGTVTAVFQAGERAADQTQTVSGSSTKDEIRIWPPIAVARCTDLVVGLQGIGLTVYAVRASGVSSGRGSPL